MVNDQSLLKKIILEKRRQFLCAKFTKNIRKKLKQIKVKIVNRKEGAKRPKYLVFRYFYIFGVFLLYAKSSIWQRFQECKYKEIDSFIITQFCFPSNTVHYTGHYTVHYSTLYRTLYSTL